MQVDLPFAINTMGWIKVSAKYVNRTIIRGRVNKARVVVVVVFCAEDSYWYLKAEMALGFI